MQVLGVILIQSIINVYQRLSVTTHNNTSLALRAIDFALDNYCVLNLFTSFRVARKCHSISTHALYVNIGIVVIGFTESANVDVVYRAMHV